MSWSTLAQVQQVKVKDRVVPQYADGVLKLNATEVKLQGFMMPLEMGDKQKQFVLTAMPQSCAFCLPGGPEQLVLVQAKAPVKYTMEPVILSGKLAVLKDDPNGLYYRLDNAVIDDREVRHAPSRAALAPRAGAGRCAARDPRACAVAPRQRAVRARRRRSSRPTHDPASCLAFEAAAGGAVAPSGLTLGGEPPDAVAGLASADPLLPSIALSRFASRAPPVLS